MDLPVSLATAILLTIAIMSPGVLKAMIFMGGLYLFYVTDQRVATKNNGWRILHTWIDKIVGNGIDPHVHYAAIEESRQRTKEHYELAQRRIYRSSYPE